MFLGELFKLSRKRALQNGAEKALNKFRADNPEVTSLHDELQAELGNTSDLARIAEIVDQLSNLDSYNEADIPATWTSDETENVKRQVAAAINSINGN